jgi:hypothetical protein
MSRVPGGCPAPSSGLTLTPGPVDSKGAECRSPSAVAPRGAAVKTTCEAISDPPQNCWSASLPYIMSSLKTIAAMAESDFA